MTGMNAFLRWRAVVIGLLLGLAVCALTPYNNAYLNATPLGGGFFPLMAFFALFVITVLASLLSRFVFKTWNILSGAELMVIWILGAVASGIAYTGLVRTFFFNITAPFYFADTGNRWAENLQPLLPEGLYPRSQEAVEALYNGVPGGRTMSTLELLGAMDWAVWGPTLAGWAVYILLSYMTILCLVSLFSRQWVTNERVNFPLLRAPQLLTRAYDEQRLGAFLGNSFLVSGVVLTIFLHTVNGLSFYYPTMPSIPTLVLAEPYFPKHGFFSGFHKLKIYIIPAFIGFAFMTTRQISFSFWLFYILGALSVGALSTIGLQLPTAALGVTFGPSMARLDEAQMLGAFPVFFLFLVWLARRHLKDVICRAFFLSKSCPMDKREPSEWLSGATSFWGTVLGVAGLTAWSAYYGMPVLAAFLLILLFIVTMLVASRIVCQGGVAYFTLTAAPSDTLLALFGSKFFGQAGLLLAVSMQKMLFVDLRESLMPTLFHGAKVSEQARRGRLLLFAIAVTILLAAVVSMLAMMLLGHKYGLRGMEMDWATGTTMTAYENAQRLLSAPSAPNEWTLTFAGVGVGVMLALVIAYQRFYWWPLHPIGYLMAYSSAMRILWFSFFVGWLCNHLSLHYGGTALFNKVRNFFIGLIIGDFLMGGIWAIAAFVTGTGYQVLPA